MIKAANAKKSQNTSISDNGQSPWDFSFVN
jgi:hypothetical protein